LANPRQPVYALDHDVQNETEENKKKYQKIADFAKTVRVLFRPCFVKRSSSVLISTVLISTLRVEALVTKSCARKAMLSQVRLHFFDALML
jgi:hypothetical protein